MIELRDNLDQIRDALLNTTIGNGLWSILTALRGPDVVLNSDEAKTFGFNESRLKEATTAVIRHELYRGVERRESRPNGAIINPDSEAHRAVREAAWKACTDAALTSGGNGYKYLWHFTVHAKAAFLALGLKWDEVNE